MSNGVWLLFKDFDGEGLHANIKVETFSVGVPRAEAEENGSETAEQVSNMATVVVTKLIDENSAKLRDRISTGEKITRMAVVLTQGEGATATKLVASEFSDVLVTSMHLAEPEDEDQPPLEHVTFAFFRT